MASRCSLKGTQLAGAGDRKKCLISGSTREHDQEGEFAVAAVPSGKLHSWISTWDAPGHCAAWPLWLMAAGRMTADLRNGCIRCPAV